MAKIGKYTIFCLVVISTSSSLIIVESVNAESIPKPSVPEFTVKYVDESYDIAPTTTSTIEPYTGKTTTSTIPGYHVDKRIIQVTIRNNLNASFYNLRYKGSYVNDSWNYFPFNPDDVNGYSLHNTPAQSPPYPATISAYTVLKLYLPSSVPNDGSVDIQLQGLFGSFRQVHEGSLAAWMLGYNDTYNYYFTGQPGDWSNTQTLTISASSSSVTPTPSSTNSQLSMTPTWSPDIVSGDSTLILFSVAIAILVISVISLLLYVKKLKRSIPEN